MLAKERWQGTWFTSILGNLKPARPAIRLSRASPCLIHGVAYEDRDEGNEVAGHEGQGHEANEGRSLQGHAFVQPVMLYACSCSAVAPGDEEESSQQNRPWQAGEGSCLPGPQGDLSW